MAALSVGRGCRSLGDAQGCPLCSRIVRMSLPETDIARVRRWVARRNEVIGKNISEMRVEMDVDGRAITILDCRPPWREDLGSEWTRLEVARLRDTKKTGTAPRGVTTAVLSGVPQREPIFRRQSCASWAKCVPGSTAGPGDPHQHWRRMVSLTPPPSRGPEPPGIPDLLRAGGLVVGARAPRGVLPGLDGGDGRGQRVVLAGRGPHRASS
jgi:hypothetical protein